MAAQRRKRGEKKNVDRKTRVWEHSTAVDPTFDRLWYEHADVFKIDRYTGRNLDQFGTIKGRCL